MYFLQKPHNIKIYRLLCDLCGNMKFGSYITIPNFILSHISLILPVFQHLWKMIYTILLYCFCFKLLYGFQHLSANSAQYKPSFLWEIPLPYSLPLRFLPISLHIKKKSWYNVFIISYSLKFINTRSYIFHIRQLQNIIHLIRHIKNTDRWKSAVCIFMN